MNDNHVNCWKPKLKDRAISSQAPEMGKVQRLSEKSEYAPSGAEAHDIPRDEDIVRSPEKSEGSEVKMFLYWITFKDTDSLYIGITNNVKRRIAAHKQAAKSGKSTPLYACIRKYNEFTLTVMETYKTREEANDAEKYWISYGRECYWKLLNLADGGEGGFVITNVEDWKGKLRAARRGAKPFLGKTHSDQTKKLCGVAGSKFKLYDKEEVLKYSFKEAHEKFGISKTHYYRLKRA
jgi:group I intron endonuclease